MTATLIAVLFALLFVAATSGLALLLHHDPNCGHQGQLMKGMTQ